MEKPLLTFIKNLKAKGIIFSNEEATKQTIVLPLLQLLGWDIFNADELMPEYPVGLSQGRVDYSLRIVGSNKVFIEVKKIGEKLEFHREKLLNRYFNKGIDIAILTNGMTWQFYIPLIEKGKTQQEFSLITIDVLNEKSSDVASKFIDLLYKENIATGSIEQTFRATLSLSAEHINARTKKIQPLIKVVEQEPLSYDEFIKTLKPMSEPKIDRCLKRAVEEKDINYRLFYFYRFLPKEEIKVKAEKTLLKLIEEMEQSDKLTSGALSLLGENIVNIPSKELSLGGTYISKDIGEVIFLKYYARTKEAYGIENRFQNFFLPFKADLSCIPDFRYSIIKKKILTTLDLKRKKTVREYIGGGDFFSKNDNYNMTEEMIKNQFDQIKNNNPIYIEFSRVNWNRMPRIIFYGFFTEKTFELTFRNVLYTYKNYAEITNLLRKWLICMNNTTNLMEAENN